MPQLVTVTVSNTYEGETMDCVFAIWREGEFWYVGLAMDVAEGNTGHWFDELDSYPEALAFALEGDGAVL